MRTLRMIGVALAGLLAAEMSGAIVHAEDRQAVCDASLVERIPPRSASAPDGHAIAGSIQSLDGDAREQLVREQILSGNLPRFLRHLEPIELSAAGQSQVTLCVMPDYVAIGSNEDYLLVPMRLETALEIGRHLGFMLPTPKVVDAISRQSQVHLAPQPLPASDRMRSSAYLIEHNALVREQRQQTGDPLGALTCGDKKDLVLTNRLWQRLESVAIYGWHALDGRPIQPLSTLHGWHYVDYSHGVRFVSDRVFVDGRPRALLDVLEDPHVAPLLNSEGMILGVSELIERLRAPHTRAATGG